jgi:hypothetical protein
MISTDVFVKSLSMYRTKTKALGVLIQNETAVYMVERSDTDIADIITTVLEWAAQNIESLAAVIDPIVKGFGSKYNRRSGDGHLFYRTTAHTSS